MAQRENDKVQKQTPSIAAQQQLQPLQQQILLQQQQPIQQHILKPQTSQQQILQPQISQQQILQPQTSQQQILQPHTSQQKNLQPRIAQQQILQPQTSQQQILQPQTSQQQILQPQISQQQILQPHTSQQQILQPHTSQQHILQPQTSQQQTLLQQHPQQPLQQQVLQQQPLQQQILQQQPVTLNVPVSPVLQIGCVNNMNFRGQTPSLSVVNKPLMTGVTIAMAGNQSGFLNVPTQSFTGTIIGQGYQQTGNATFSAQPLITNTVLMPVMKQTGAQSLLQRAPMTGAIAVRQIRPKPAGMPSRRPPLTVASHLAVKNIRGQHVQNKRQKLAGKLESRHISSILTPPSILAVPHAPLRTIKPALVPNTQPIGAQSTYNSVTLQQMAPINLVVKQTNAITAYPSCVFSQNSAADLRVKTNFTMPVPRAGSATAVSCAVPVNSQGHHRGIIGGVTSEQASVSNQNDSSEKSQTNVLSAAESTEFDEFIWEEYLEDNNAVAAPPTTFRHVECSVQSGFEKHMKLEVANKNGNGTYWLASIQMSCGQLLRLRYDGYADDASADFWCDVTSSDIHPIGWCAVNRKSLQPPDEIKDKRQKWDEFLCETLSGCKTAPAYLLDGRTGSTPLEQLQAGMHLELQHEMEPQLLWIVCIRRNVGGRLLLHFEGMDVTEENGFWLFYLHHRLHPIGWATQHGCIYKPTPEMLQGQTSRVAWAEILTSALTKAKSKPLSPDIFKDQVQVKEHSMQIGWKLEVLHPTKRTCICPGTITELVDEHYFTVELDSITQQMPVRWCGHSQSYSVFPVGWAEQNGLKLTPPIGWSKETFDWTSYLAETSSQATPKELFNMLVTDHEFENGMKLECVNPSRTSEVCAATVTGVVGPLLWLRLDHTALPPESFIDDVHSQDIYPVGWADSNDYPLAPPVVGIRKRRVAVVQPEVNIDRKKDPSYTNLKESSAAKDITCPKIYINHRCFSGPYLSKGRLSELPQCVGPGSVTLVMREVLSMLIGVAYKSSRVLKELQVDGETRPNMQATVLKAKYKGKSYRALVEICRTRDQVEHFCKQVCVKLECCQNLFSPNNVNGSCPLKCYHLTKTTYTQYCGKKTKRKMGRPAGRHTNLENGECLPGQKRKRRRFIMTHRKKSTTMTVAAVDMQETPFDMYDYDDSDNSVSMPQKKRKYVHRTLPPTEIRTRCARGPKFTFERRTHQKIPIALSKAGTKRHMKQKMDTNSQTVQKGDVLQLKSNPLSWSVSNVASFMKTTDCANLTRLFFEQEIDGQALLLLTLSSIQEYLELKLGPAIKLCHQIESIKVAFYEQYAPHK